MRGRLWVEESSGRDSRAGELCVIIELAALVITPDRVMLRVRSITVAIAVARLFSVPHCFQTWGASVLQRMCVLITQHWVSVSVHIGHICMVWKDCFTSLKCGGESWFHMNATIKHQFWQRRTSRCSVHG